MTTTATQILRLLAQADTKELDAVPASLDKIDHAADKAEKSGSRLGSALSTTGKVAAGVAAGGVVALAGGLFAATKKAADFEQSIANVSSVTGATKDELALLRQEALNVGRDTSKSASESVLAFGELLKAGMSVQDVVGGAGRTVVQLAEATGTSVEDMAVLLSNSLNTFGLSADKSAAVADTLARAANASAIDVSDLGQSLQAVGPVAKQAGLTMDQFATAMGIMGNHALKGSDAGTSLKTMLLALTAPTDKARGLMQAYGIEVFDANGKTRDFRAILGDLQTSLGNLSDEEKSGVLKDIFGTDAIRAANILLEEGVEGWDKFGAAMGAAPTVAEMSTARLNTLNGKIEQLKGSLETMAIMVGEKVLPYLTTAADKAVEWANKLMAVNWGELLAPVVQTIQTQVVPAFQRGVEIAGQIVDVVRERWPQIRETIQSAINDVAPVVQRVMGDVQAAFEQVVSFVQDKWPQIRETASGIFDAIKTAVDGVLREVTPTLDAIVSYIETIVGEIRERWGMIEDIIGPVIEFAVRFVKDQLNILSNVIQTVLNVIQGDWSGAWDNVKAIAASVWDQIKALVKLQIELIPAILALGYELIKDAVEAGWNLAKTATSAAWDEIKKLAGEALDAVIKKMGDLTEWFRDKFTHPVSTFKGLMADARDAAGWVVDKVQALIGKLSDLWNWLSKPFKLNIDFPSPPGWLSNILPKTLAPTKEELDTLTLKPGGYDYKPGPLVNKPGGGQVVWTSPETGWMQDAEGRWYQIVSTAMQEAARAADALAASASTAATALIETAAAAAVNTPIPGAAGGSGGATLGGEIGGISAPGFVGPTEAYGTEGSANCKHPYQIVVVNGVPTYCFELMSKPDPARQAWDPSYFNPGQFYPAPPTGGGGYAGAVGGAAGGGGAAVINLAINGQAFAQAIVPDLDRVQGGMIEARLVS